MATRTVGDANSFAAHASGTNSLNLFLTQAEADEGLQIAEPITHLIQASDLVFNDFGSASQVKFIGRISGFNNFADLQEILIIGPSGISFGHLITE